MLRLTLAALAGFLTMLVAVALTTVVLVRQLFPGLQGGMNAGSLPVAYLLAALVYRTLYAVIGGCVTAAIGRKPEAPIILGALMLGVGIGGLLFHQAGEPIWSVALAPILSAFAATFAGFAWLGHQRRN